MKIIHSADQHLDSRMKTHLGDGRARERKNELLKTFMNMVSYAAEHGVEAILLCGDLFDTKTVAASERKAVEAAIVDNPSITFFYLKGNHDNNSFLASLEEAPSNLKLFGEGWTGYHIGNRITVTGAELFSENSGILYNSLSLNASDINIVMLHGQENNYGVKDKTEIVALGELRNKNIDYLALGHIHSYKRETLDARGVYCYSGCLEGRGFDECGDKGFVLLDINEDTGAVASEFIPFASRRLHEIHLDISDCMNTPDIKALFDSRRAAEDFNDRDLYKIVLEGRVDIECQKNTDYLGTFYKDDYYYVKFVDNTEYKVDYEAFALDESLKGEFIRTVRARTDIDDEQKARIVRIGIAMLRGEGI